MQSLEAQAGTPTRAIYLGALAGGAQCGGDCPPQRPLLAQYKQTEHVLLLPNRLTRQPRHRF